MNARRALVFGCSVMSALLMFLVLQFALQRVEATVESGSSPLDSPLAPPDDLISPLNSPLQPPESLPDTEEEPVDIESLTHKTYVPFILALQNKFGTEVDSEFANYRGADKIEQAGFGWYRHMQVSWASFEPISGVYTMTPEGPAGWYQDLDDGLARAVSSGLQPIVVIRDSPQWATVALTRGCTPITPTLYTHFADFVNMVIDKYEQPPYNVRYYELFNEPDIWAHITDTEKGCWTLAQYVDMLEVVYPAVKVEHPNILLVNGGLSDAHSAWARDLISYGYDYLDVLAYHAYEKTDQNGMWLTATTTTPAIYLRALEQLKAWIKQYHPSSPLKPIIMNEGGLLYNLSLASNTYEATKISQGYFAAFMAAHVTGDDIKLYSWFRSWERPDGWPESAYGDSENYTYLTNTLYTALAFSLAQARNAVYITTTFNTNGASIVKLMNKDDKELWLLWNTHTSNSTPFTYTFGVSPYKVWDVWGNELQISTTLYMTHPVNAVWVQLYE
jgi:hypothetical protein